MHACIRTRYTAMAMQSSWRVRGVPGLICCTCTCVECRAASIYSVMHCAYARGCGRAGGRPGTGQCKLIPSRHLTRCSAVYARTLYARALIHCLVSPYMLHAGGQSRGRSVSVHVVLPQYVCIHAQYVAAIVGHA
jgi:hypothetical protein